MKVLLPALWLVGFAAVHPCLLAEDDSASLKLTSPGSQVSWSAGSFHNIAWQLSGGKPHPTVAIRFSTDGGVRWTTIAKSAPNTGYYPWRVPDSVSADCRIDVAFPQQRAEARFAITPSREVLDYQWVKVTDSAAFAPRDGAGALVFGKRMWLLGGWNPYDKEHFPRICNNEVWSSPDGVLWDPVKPNTFTAAPFDATRDWEGRHTAGYVVFKSRLWIVGGDANQGHYHNDVWNSRDGRRWTHVNRGRPAPWGPRALHYTLVFDGKIWVIGGQTMPRMAPADEVFYRDVWHSDDGVHWVQLRPEEPYWPARGMIGGNVVHRGRIWILGGGRYDTPSSPAREFYNDVWSSADGVRWRQELESAPWVPRQYHEVAVFDDRMWVLEGSHKPGVSRNDVWYSVDGRNWYELPGTPWKPRHAASVFVHNDALWMLGGSDRGKMDKQVWKLIRTADAGR